MNSASLVATARHSLGGLWLAPAPACRSFSARMSRGWTEKKVRQRRIYGKQLFYSESTGEWVFVGNHSLLLIDEAQRIPGIGLTLKLLHDNLPDLQIVATGSSTLDLVSKTAEHLTGRKRTFILYPIAQSELRLQATPAALKKDVDQRLIWGSYPEIITTIDIRERRARLQELTDSYLYKDVLELNDIRNPSKVRDLLKLVAFQIGGTVSHAELATQLGISQETVGRYLHLLEESFVLFKVGGFSRNLRKEVTKTNKYYFYDLGVRNALINNLNDLNTRNDIGGLWENFLVLERLKFLHYTQQITTPYFWRTYTGAEIDYVEERDGQLFGYEMKSGKKKSKPPKSWLETYREASWQIINRDNWFSFVTNEGS